MRTLMLLLCLLTGTAYAADPIEALSQPVPAPAFSLKDLDGTAHSLNQYRGKVLIVNFWATWCPPCRAEMPAFNRMWHKLDHRHTQFVAINVGEDADTIFTFISEQELDFPILLDPDGREIERWPMKALPTTFIIDTDGNIRYRAVGSREWDQNDYIELIRRLVR
jgi:peroxiredoxin